MLGSLSETKVAYTSSAPANGLPGINYPARLSTGLSILTGWPRMMQEHCMNGSVYIIKKFASRQVGDIVCLLQYVINNLPACKHFFLHFNASHTC